MVDWNAGGGIRARVAEVATANGCSCGEGQSCWLDMRNDERLPEARLDRRIDARSADSASQ